MPYKFLEIKNKLKRLWFDIVRQKWSHVIFSNGKTTFPVPNHGTRDISPGVESKILNFVNMKRKEFDDIK
jgi:predicted RNA binding protein YcfA (HicA-like mRNA interferase family)